MEDTHVRAECCKSHSHSFSLVYFFFLSIFPGQQLQSSQVLKVALLLSHTHAGRKFHLIRANFYENSLPTLFVLSPGRISPTLLPFSGVNNHKSHVQHYFWFVACFRLPLPLTHDCPCGPLQ